MVDDKDALLSRVTARLRDTKSGRTIGTAIIYFEKALREHVYILTAAHNLYEDGDVFKKPRGKITIDILHYVTGKYHSIQHIIDYTLVQPDVDQDLAVLVLNRVQVEKIVAVIPAIHMLRGRIQETTFVTKGFPNATQGIELASINLTWVQEMIDVHKFQLTLHEDYSSYATGGFSGSGIFLGKTGELYLLGIFTRYRAEEKGRVVYCQFVQDLNVLLVKNFKTPISTSFIGGHGLTPSYFSRHITEAIKNLGPRYNPLLNFDLPVAKLFNDLARDRVFRTRLTKGIDEWLIDHGHGHHDNHKHLVEVTSELKNLKERIKDWLVNLDWSPDKTIDIDFIHDSINEINKRIDKCRFNLYELQREASAQEEAEAKKSYSYRPPFDPEINRLYEIMRTNGGFLRVLEEIHTDLSNHPCLLMEGDPGCGKSHLLGDISSERHQTGAPTLLILGQQFRSGQTAWQNVMAQLSLSCTKEELLTSLNHIGQQIGSRVLFMIDALNEGGGKDIWPSVLAGFIESFKPYPFIGLVLTVRSTYYRIIIPEGVKADPNVIKFVHDGFKGNEYAALKQFCEFHGLQQPVVPILAPEYSNPLFLQLICEGLKRAGIKKFPKGIQGITAVFDLYLKAIYAKLGEGREEYRTRQHLIRQAILAVAKAIHEKNNWGSMLLSDAADLLDKNYAVLPHLLDDLIRENVFMQTFRWNRERQQEEESISFAYERLGDFLTATELLEPFSDAPTVRAAFQKDQPLGKLVDGQLDAYRGTIQIMAVILPEKFKLEIVDVYDWVFERAQREFEQDNFYHVDFRINETLIESLKWREVTSISNQKITNWINSKHFRLRQQDIITAMIELATVQGNPFNSDRLFKYLSKFSLPERDVFLQPYLRYFSSSSEDEGAAPLRRLIDWAWQPGISMEIDAETARLAGQTLVWAFASTKIKLRDEVTKALVNLLEEQPSALLNILKAFKDCNDPYIIERLYAVAYGCVLRTSDKAGIKRIAQFAYNEIFKHSPVPSHILVRDYARNIIEYALYRKQRISGTLKRIRPPYGHSMPDYIPTKKEIDDLEISHEEADYQKNFSFYHNQIMHSVIEWDFGRYIIDPVLDDFVPASFTFEKESKAFLKEFPKNERSWINLYISFKVIEHEFVVNHDKYQGHDETTRAKLLGQVQEAIVKISEDLRKFLTKKQFDYIKLKLAPHHLALSDAGNWQRNVFDTQPIKRWIVQRVFELGYDSTIHGEYEKSVNAYDDRHEHRIERIGKKYQWIAFHEAVGMIADNYYRKKEAYTNNSEVAVYDGAFVDYVRDIDPAFTTRNRIGLENNEVHEREVFNPNNWWHIPTYGHWDRPDEAWVSMLNDLPDVSQILTAKDNTGHEWLCLCGFTKWRKPKAIGEEKYSRQNKEIFYMVQAYLVRKRDKAKIIDHLSQQNFFNRWMPESHRANSSLFNRENYWAPATAYNEEEVWKPIRNTQLMVMTTTSEAVGEMSADKSGAHFRYDMPCKLLFEGMKLKYSKTDGEFVSSNGETLVMNPAGRGILVRKDKLDKFLKANGLDIIWTLLGEKYSFHSDSHERNHFKVLNGVYTIHRKKLKGSIRLRDRS